MEINIKSVLLLCLSICGLIACRKNRHYGIDGKLAAAVAFDSGSYFIYQDSLNGSIDSFWVNRLGILTGSSTDESFAFSGAYYSIIDSSGEEFYFAARGSKSKLKEVNGYYALDTSNAYEGHWLSDPFNIGTAITHTFGLYNCVNYYDSYTIKGHAYENVYVVKGRSLKIPVTASSDTITYTSYYSLNSGLLKFDINRGSNHIIKEIVRANVVKQ